MMRKKSLDSRPVNLNLFTIKFPITAITSILHRVTGFALFLALPIILYAWQLSLQNLAGFNNVKLALSAWYFKLLLWLVLAGFCYHVIAGIRHLLMDLHIGDTKKGGRVGAYCVLGLSSVLILVLGVSLW